MEQWLFTFDSATGEVCRVEKLDPLSAEPQELSDAEYAALSSYLEMTPPQAAAPGPEKASPPEPELSEEEAWVLERAYWRGVMECAALYRHYLDG